jgi:hypothetical protein
MTELAEWENFYVIVGSSAGALIGLQFVVITLVAEKPIARSAALGSAFATPTIIHFCTVLVLSALVSAPWHGIGTVATLWGLMGLSGLIYVLSVAWRLPRQKEYKPVFEDWMFHVLLPLAAYVALTIPAFAARTHTREALFAIGAAALLLLLVGIHNTWDALVYHVFAKRQ